METRVTLPEGFEETMAIPNAAERLREAREVGDRLLGRGDPVDGPPRPLCDLLRAAPAAG